jgi:hypothetical protein
MSYQYVIPTGQLFQDGNLIGTGWAGRDTAAVQGQNNPAAICEQGIGPLPPGCYTIGDPEVFKGMQTCFALDPDPENQMCHRGDFFIHGALIVHTIPDQSSDGCIIQLLAVRQQIAAAIKGTANDDPARRLQVTLA